MTKVTIHAAKTNLSKLIAQVEAGEEVTIYRGDTPVAVLGPVKPQSMPDVEAWDGESPRKPGLLKGLIGPTSEDAFAPMTDEEIKEWEEGPVFPPDRT